MNHDHHVRCFSGDFQVDRGVFSAVLDGVTEQVGDRLAKTVGIPLANLLALGVKADDAVGVGGAAVKEMCGSAHASA